MLYFGRTRIYLVSTRRLLWCTPWFMCGTKSVTDKKLSKSSKLSISLLTHTHTHTHTHAHTHTPTARELILDLTSPKLLIIPVWRLTVYGVYHSRYLQLLLPDWIRALVLFCLWSRYRRWRQWQWRCAPGARMIWIHPHPGCPGGFQANPDAPTEIPVSTRDVPLLRVKNVEKNFFVTRCYVVAELPTITILQRKLLVVSGKK